MGLGKSKPLSWFTEIFTKDYFKTHVFSTIFIYAIFLIILMGLVQEIRSFSLASFGAFLLHVLFAGIVICLIKLFFEKYKL